MAKVYLEKTVVSEGLYADFVGTVKAVVNGDLKFSSFGKLGLKLTKGQRQNLKMSLDILRKTGNTSDNAIGCMLSDIIVVK